MSDWVEVPAGTFEDVRLALRFAEMSAESLARRDSHRAWTGRAPTSCVRAVLVVHAESEDVLQGHHVPSLVWQTGPSMPIVLSHQTPMGERYGEALRRIASLGGYDDQGNRV